MRTSVYLPMTYYELVGMMISEMVYNEGMSNESYLGLTCHDHDD